MSEAVKEYGQALADLAVEEQLEEILRTQSARLKEIFEQNPAYTRLLANPEIPKAERCALLEESLGGRVHPYLLNFLKILTERGYAYRSADFLAEYERIYCERHSIARADCASAVALTEEQKTRLREKLEGITGKKIELVCRVDPSLIGGIRLLLDNTLFDGSVRARLDEMRASLMALTL